MSDAAGRPAPRVGLSTTSVFPEAGARAFEIAARVGYDGVEIMVSGLDGTCQDPGALCRLRDRHQVPVLAIHAPTLLISQRTWGAEPWGKLERAAAVARQVGADVVVVHPAFRWQRDYARGFLPGLRRLTETTGVTFCLENMYPWRTPGGEFLAYLPGWDPTGHGYEHLCLDLSHASTARVRAVDYVRAWGPRLRHIHLTDGSGKATDEHLLPGEGDQCADQVLRLAAARGFAGHVIVEANTRRAGAAAREEVLARALAFARVNLAAGEAR